MIITLLMICGILYLALQLEKVAGVPSPLGLIALAFFAHLLFQSLPLLTGNMPNFAELVILLLPILLISDSIHLKLAELKEQALSLFYLAVVAVSLSVITALFVSDFLFSKYELSFAAIILLFSMVLATDPVSVVSVFSRFKLPHRLKILCEGESLFNDATALIVFVFIGLYALDGGNVSYVYVMNTSITVLFGSILLGAVVGYVGLIALKSTNNRMAELLLLIVIGYGSFELAEKFYALLSAIGIHGHTHFSGILSCICSMLIVQYFMGKTDDYHCLRFRKEEEELRKESRLKQSSQRLIDLALTKIISSNDEQQRHQRTREDVQLLALVANTILFIALAEIIDFTLLMKYWQEILTMFVATTLIRALMMAKFAFITNNVAHMSNVNFRWWGVLTFAGIKGGLSIVMLMMIPPDFIHLEMFTAVVVGVIILSTFIYSLALILIINVYGDEFLRELEQEDTV